MIDLNEIHSLTDFQRNTKEFLGRLKASGKPLVLTVNGRAEIVVQDAASYQKLIGLIERLEAVEGVREGLKSMKQAKGTPARSFFTELRKEHDIAERKQKKK